MNNKVELIGYYGDDLVHACSAWTSTSRDLNEDKIKRVGKLLDMLASNGHHTPFEKSSLHFLVDTDIASHIHLLKHRIGVLLTEKAQDIKKLKKTNTSSQKIGPQNGKKNCEIIQIKMNCITKSSKILKNHLKKTSKRVS